MDGWKERDQPHNLYAHIHNLWTQTIGDGVRDGLEGVTVGKKGDISKTFNDI